MTKAVHTARFPKNEEITLQNPAPAPALAPGTMARLMAAAPNLNPERALELAETCRRAGAIDEARLLIERLGEQAPPLSAPQRLSSALRGELPICSGHLEGPIAFIRRKNFLPQALHARIRDDLRRGIDQFEDSRLLVGDEEVYASERRQSRSKRKLGAYRVELELYITNLLAEFPASAELMERQAATIDMHAQVHAHGDFFGAHSDLQAGSRMQRVLSFVYYMHTQPKVFTGGDLLIYDGRESADSFNASFFTRITPDDNSIIVFPSRAVHEVTSVSMPGAARENGRLTISGALLLNNSGE